MTRRLADLILTQLAPQLDAKPANQQAGWVKTTFDLPPDLVRAMKLRAVHEGRKLKDVAADLLQRGLASPAPQEEPKLAKPRIEVQSSGLPVVRCALDAPATRMTPAELLHLEQDALRQEDIQRLGHAL